MYSQAPPGIENQHGYPGVGLLARPTMGQGPHLKAVAEIMDSKLVLLKDLRAWGDGRGRARSSGQCNACHGLASLGCEGTMTCWGWRESWGAPRIITHTQVLGANDNSEAGEERTNAWAVTLWAGAGLCGDRVWLG